MDDTQCPGEHNISDVSKLSGCYIRPLKFCHEPRQPVCSHSVGTRECDEQVAKHYDTAVVNFAGIKYPLKIYSGGEPRQPVLAGVTAQ